MTPVRGGRGDGTKFSCQQPQPPTHPSTQPTNQPTNHSTQGWGATAGYQDQWTWDQASETYALDPEMAAKLRAANPQAYANVLRRCLEAAGRGIWRPDEKVVEQLRQKFAEMDDELEGVVKPR